MRISPDTNVLISATFWHGDSSRIIESAEKKKHQLVLSNDIVQEYDEVLKYEEIQSKIKDKNLEMKYSVGKIMSLAEIVYPKEKVDVIKDDPDDNKILECAKEGMADCIISNDGHLLKLSKFEGIQIITPREFIRKYPYPPQ